MRKYRSLLSILSNSSSKLFILQYQVFFQEVYNIIMSTQCFKGLLPKNLMLDDAFNPLNKKVEEYRKITQLSIDFFQMVQRIFDLQYNQYEKSLESIDFEEDVLPDYYIEYLDVFEEISSQTKIFNEKVSGSFKQMTSLCGVVFSDYSNAILGFTQQVRSYQNNEQILFQMAKKYFRSMKTVQNSIESYKTSFSDVKLIYNNEERLKRYNTCKIDYDNICTDHSHIQEKVDKVNDMKDHICKTYDGLNEQLGRMLRSIGTRKISEAKVFTTSFCSLKKKLITMFAEKKIILDKIKLQSIVTNKDLAINPEHFSCEIQPEKHKDVPPLLYYHEFLKQEYAHVYTIALIQYPKQLASKMNERKIVNKKIFEFTMSVVKLLEKNHLPGLKEAISFFDKNKKKIGEIFSNKFVSFSKSIFSLLDISQGIYQKLLKTVQPKAASIQNLLVQDSKTFDLIKRQLENNMEKLVGKKDIKKLKNLESEVMEQDNNIDSSKLKKQISSKAVFLTHFIDAMNSKINKTYEKIRQILNGIINDLFLSENELYSLACEYQVMYFGQEQFSGNFLKYQNDLKNVLQREKQFFKNINFGILQTEKNIKIVFNGEPQKYQEFKKLKKPIENKIDTIVESKTAVSESKVGNQSASSPIPEKQQNQNSSGDQKGTSEGVQGKQMQFLAKKVQLVKGQQFVKSFACALSDKIILQGRLYITTERICFHSKFNPSTVFFGGTFIQIPKNDIKKLQKRYNAIFFDNSISVTTINGEIFLTSFFSRDEAFQLLCRTFEINDDHAIQLDDEKSILIEDQKVGPMEDDISQEELKKRIIDMKNRVCPEYNYKDSVNTEIQFEGISALKMFKIFYSGQETIINKKSYRSFWHYYKQIIQTKQLEIEEWQPNVFEYLNPDNIKSKMPLEFKRKIIGTCPINNPGVPFMPKFAKSTEHMKLFIFSKDKWMLENQIQTKGAPYTDCFQMHTRTTVETKSENSCSFHFEFAIQFFSKPMISGMIQSKSHSENTDFQKIWVDEIRKYFKNLNKLKNKNKLKNNENKEAADADDFILDEAYQQLNQAKKEVKALKNDINELKVQKDKQRKILLGSLILNLLLLLIWLS